MNTIEDILTIRPQVYKSYKAVAWLKMKLSKFLLIIILFTNCNGEKNSINKPKLSCEHYDGLVFFNGYDTISPIIEFKYYNRDYTIKNFPELKRVNNELSWDCDAFYNFTNKDTLIINIGLEKHTISGIVLKSKAFGLQNGEHFEQCVLESYNCNGIKYYLQNIFIYKNTDDIPPNAIKEENLEGG
jgi:hypothetical protein